MIRFVHLGTQIGGIDDDGSESQHFAFYDTVRGVFVTTSDGQTQIFWLT